MLDYDTYSIYAVETKVKPQNGQNSSFSYHSFLLLMGENDDGTRGALQELHFVHSERQISECEGEEGLKTIPCLHGITKPANRDYSQMHFEKFAVGNQEEMLAQWNKMTEIAGSLSALRIKFTQNAGRDAVNCRTGTRAVLKALGHDFKPFVDGADAGATVCVLNKVKDIIVDATPRLFSPEELQQRFKDFNPTSLTL